MSTANPQQPLDSRLLSAMKRLRLENINLQRQMRTLQSDCESASSEANESGSRKRQLEVQLTEAEKQIGELQEMKLRVEALESEQQHWESQRQAITGLAQRQTLELQELRTLLAERDEQIAALQQANQTGSQELERVKQQARQVIVQHYQAMKTAQEQAQQAFEEVRRNKSQMDAIRAPIGANRRKVLPPRSLRPMSLNQGANS